MRGICFSLLLFFFIGDVSGQDCHCFKPAIEIGFGPQWTFPVLTDYDVGIVDKTKPSLKSIPNYRFHIGIHTHPSAFQAGMEIIQDRKKFNVFLPVQWPSMIPAKWNNDYTSYRLGLGINLRYHLGLFFIQGGGATMHEISYDTKSELEEPGVGPHLFDEAAYSPKSGLVFNGSIGFSWTAYSRLSTTLDFTYDTAENEFHHDQFAHYWKVRTNAIGLTVNYQINKIE